MVANSNSPQTVSLAGDRDDSLLIALRRVPVFRALSLNGGLGGQTMLLRTGEARDFSDRMASIQF